MVPVQILVNLGTLLDITGIPVVWKFVLLVQVPHDGPTIVNRKARVIMGEEGNFLPPSYTP